MLVARNTESNILVILYIIIFIKNLWVQCGHPEIVHSLIRHKFILYWCILFLNNFFTAGITKINSSLER